MAAEKYDGLKSSFDLAMERLAAREGPMRSLTTAQKNEIAEIEQKTRARIAEMEILYAQKIAQATESENVMELKQELHARTQREREQADAQKEQVRGGEK